MSWVINLLKDIKSEISALPHVRLKKTIGFLVQNPLPYAKVIASTRLRAYDVINYLNKTNNFFAELYKPWRKYDICVFQKYFNADALDKLIKIKKQGTKVLLDINVNYFENLGTDRITEKHTRDIMRFGKEVDGFITVSTFLKKVVQKYFPNKKTIFIPENINKRLFTVQKVHKSKSKLHLLYIGYSAKAKEVLIIKDILEKLGHDYTLEMVFICEKDPEIKFRNLKTRYIKFNLKKLPKQLLCGDIFVSPRDLHDSYNLAHAFTKIGYPMAVGLPVIASPLESYFGSPAILCRTDKEWESNLRILISNPNLRNKLADQGIKYCKENFSLDLIGKQYEKYFTELINDGISRTRPKDVSS